MLNFLGGLFGGGKGGGGLLGGLGNMVGSLTSIIPNMVNMGIAAHKAKKAESMNPGLYNPLQVDLLEEIKAKKKALETGTAYAGAQRQLAQQNAQALRTAGNLAGGDVGMMMGALKGINRQGGVNQNALFDQMSQEGVQLTNVMNNLVNNMANRQYQISMADKLQRMASAQEALKESQQGLRSSLSLGLDKMNLNDVVKSRSSMNSFGVNLAQGGQEMGGMLTSPMNPIGQIPNTQVPMSLQPMTSDYSMLQRAQFNPNNYYQP